MLQIILNKKKQIVQKIGKDKQKNMKRKSSF